MTRVVALACLVLSFASCRPPSEAGSENGTEPSPTTWLVDITDSSGVDFTHTTGGTGSLYLPEIMGGGVAVFDADNDGRPDLYFVNQNDRLPSLEPGTDVNRFFRQTSDGTFVDATAESGLGDGGYGMGAAVGDVDNDGDLDVFVTNLGPDRLFLNDGGGRFEDATSEAGLEIPGLSVSAAFFDFDLDNDLDLFVTQYVWWDAATQCTADTGKPTYCGPKAFPPVPDRLFRNEGGARFVDVSKQAGIASVAAAGLGVVVEDFDHNGFPDLYVANDAYANNLWLNQGDGRFIDDALILGAAFNNLGQPEAGMGVLVEDLDGDGLSDVFLTHLEQESNTFYRRLPNGLGFRDASAGSGLATTSWQLTGFGAAALDLELDGDLDLAIANGRVTLAIAPSTGSSLPAPWDHLAEPNLVFVNDGGVFRPSGPPTTAFTDPVEISRGLVPADLDRDGDLDLVLANIQGKARIYRNEAPRSGDWLMIRALDGTGTDAIGATVTLESNGVLTTRTVRRTTGYASSSPPHVHFALPTQSGYSSVLVRWPDGNEERFSGGSGNEHRTLRRGLADEGPVSGGQVNADQSPASSSSAKQAPESEGQAP